jgi:hypothetical protein
MKAPWLVSGFAWISVLGLMLQSSSAQTQNVTIYGVDTGNQLVSFSSNNPASVKSTAITGLQSGERVVGMDFRPKDGKLYGISSQSRMYTLNVITGAVTPVGSASFTPSLAGSAFGMDFNPLPDRIRTHSDGDQNLRLHPDTGAVVDADTNMDGTQPDGMLTYVAGDAAAGQNPNLVGTAYTNSVVGATITTLYAIDSARDTLVTLASPNNGQIATVGALGLDTTDAVGFDIAPLGNIAYATLTESQNGPSSLYALNLTTGKATLVARVGSAAPLVGIAIAP